MAWNLLVNHGGKMSTNKTIDARISALADNALEVTQHEQLLLALHMPEVMQTWETYHCIGDVLRSPDTAVHFTPGFSAKMADLLAAEPALLGAAAVAGSAVDSSATEPWKAAAMMRRFGMRGAGLAAAIVLTLITIPKFGHLFPAGESLAAISTHADAIGGSGKGVAGEVLRNPQIDEYLLAHQRYSPSVYNTAQFARSATFATDK